MHAVLIITFAQTTFAVPRPQRFASCYRRIAAQNCASAHTQHQRRPRERRFQRQDAAGTSTAQTGHADIIAGAPLMLRHVLASLKTGVARLSPVALAPRSAFLGRPPPTITAVGLLCGVSGPGLSGHGPPRTMVCNIQQLFAGGGAQCSGRPVQPWLQLPAALSAGAWGSVQQRGPIAQARQPRPLSLTHGSRALLSSSRAPAAVCRSARQAGASQRRSPRAPASATAPAAQTSGPRLLQQGLQASGQLRRTWAARSLAGSAAGSAAAKSKRSDGDGGGSGDMDATQQCDSGEGSESGGEENFPDFDSPGSSHLRNAAQHG